VHLEKSEIPDDYVVLGMEVDRGHVRSLSVDATARLERLASGQGSSVETFQREFYRHPVLRIPSVIVPREYNYILLPAAANFGARVVWAEPFRFDPRLFSAATDS
jgi:hypothetical protein